MWSPPKTCSEGVSEVSCWKFRRWRGLRFLKSSCAKGHALRNGLLLIRPVFWGHSLVGVWVRAQNGEEKSGDICEGRAGAVFSLGRPKIFKRPNVACQKYRISEMRIRIWVDLGMTITRKKCVGEHPYTGPTRVWIRGSSLFQVISQLCCRRRTKWLVTKSCGRVSPRFRAWYSWMWVNSPPIPMVPC